MHSKINNKQSGKATNGMGENISKWRDPQGLNFQKIEIAHIIQQQKIQTTHWKK